MNHLLGLIGYPLGHSFSPAFFRSKFRELGLQDWEYRLFPLPQLEAFPDLLQAEPQLVGLNVTVPYKERIIPYLDELDPLAARIGAVNTIRIRKGITRGYNTDAPAFRQVLHDVLRTEAPRSALVLGSGGASKAVCAALENEGISPLIVSRDPGPGQISYRDIDAAALATHTLIVQATPLGMFPQVEGIPDLPWEHIGPAHVLIDLVYNPEKTRFLEEGEKRGATIRNGLRMLYLQAELSWSIWTENVESWKTI